MSLKEEKAAIKLILEAADIPVTVYPYLPGAVKVPAIVIQSGSPYLERPDTFGRGRFRAHWILVLILSANSNEKATDLSDELLEDAAVALIEQGYTLEQVEPLGAIDLNGQTYQAVPFQITKQIQL